MSMTAKIPAIVLLGASSAICFGITCFYYHRTQETKVALDSLATERSSLDSDILRAKARIEAANHDDGELQSAPPADPQHPVSIAAAHVLSLIELKGFQAMMEPDPKLYGLALKYHRALVARTYGRLFRALNLTPETIGQFETLAEKHAEAQLDIVYSANRQGTPLNDPAVSSSLSQEDDRFMSAEGALLGDAEKQQWSQYCRSLPVRSYVFKLATAVALTSTPITGAQADQLTQILANASSNYQSGGTASPATVNWATVLEQAQGFLAPTQFEVLQDQLVQTQLSQLETEFIGQEMGTK